MNRTLLSTLIVILISLSFMHFIEIRAEELPEYHYVSDVERWYYERQAYRYYPHGTAPYYLDHGTAPYYLDHGTAPYYLHPYSNYPYYGYTYYTTTYNSEKYYVPYYYAVATAFTYRNVKVYEYYLKVTSEVSGAILKGSDWYREGDSASISASSTINVGSDVKYIFSGWSGDYTGASSSVTITMDKPKMVIANYKAQYHLSVKSDPSDALRTIEEGWYDEGVDKFSPTAPETVNIRQGERYIFDSWHLDGNKVFGNPIPIPIDEPHLVEAKYTIQYYLDVKSLYGNPTGSGWYNKDSTATFEVTTPVDAGLGRKWIFEQWHGDSATATSQGTITMDRPKTVTAIWRLDSTILYMIYGIVIVAIVADVIGLTIVISRYRASRGLPTLQPCKSCGYKLNPLFNFCPVCGFKKGRAQQSAVKG